MNGADWQAISALAELLGALLVLVGFGFVVRQLRSNSVQQLYCRMYEIHRLFIEKPYLRPYFYENWDVPDRASWLAVEVDATSEMLADFFQQVFLELDLLPRSAASGWRIYMKDTLDHSQVLQRYVNAHRDWYPSNFVGKLLYSDT